MQRSIIVGMGFMLLVTVNPVSAADPSEEAVFGELVRVSGLDDYIRRSLTEFWPRLSEILRAASGGNRARAQAGSSRDFHGC